MSFNLTFRMFPHTSSEVNVNLNDIVLFLFSDSAFYCHAYLSYLMLFRLTIYVFTYCEVCRRQEDNNRNE